MPQNQATVTKGATLRVGLYLSWDLSGASSITSELRDNYGEGTLLATLTYELVTNPRNQIANALLTLILAAEDSEPLEVGRDDYEFDVRIVIGGEVRYIPSVKLNVRSRVTLP